MKTVTANLVASGLLLAALAAVVWPRPDLADTPPSQTCSQTDGQRLGVRRVVSDHSNVAPNDSSSEIVSNAILTSSPARTRKSSVAPVQQQLSTMAHSRSHLVRGGETPVSAHVSGNSNPPSGIVPTADLFAAPRLVTIESGADEELAPPPVIFPAALIETDSPAVSSPQAGERLAEIANNFAETLKQSELDPSSPEYRRLWSREQTVADAQFRAMYGGHAWMAHHIESHHALSGSAAH